MTLVLARGAFWDFWGQAMIVALLQRGANAEGYGHTFMRDRVDFWLNDIVGYPLRLSEVDELCIRKAMERTQK